MPSDGEEIEPGEPLRTTFSAGTHPIGQHLFGLQGVVPGIYRVEGLPYSSGGELKSRYIKWAFHNSPNPKFDTVLSGGSQTPFLLPVADARFLTVDSDGGLWKLAEAY